MKTVLLTSAACLAALALAFAWATSDDGVPARPAARALPGEAKPDDRRDPVRPQTPGVPRAPAPPAAPAGKVSTLPALDCERPRGPVATVDGTPIEAEPLCADLERVAGAWARMSAADQASQARRLLDRRVDGLLVARALAALGATPAEAEVDAAMPAGAKDGEREALRAQLRERLSLDKLVSLQGKLAVSDAEVAAAVANPPPGAQPVEAVTVEAWLSRVTPRSDPAVVEAAERAAQLFAKAVVAGEDPSEAARRLKLTGPSRMSVSQPGIEPDLHAAASALQPGAWSGAVKTKVAWVVARRVGDAPGVAAASPIQPAELRKRLEARRRIDERTRLLGELRSRAKIVLHVNI